MSVKGLEDLATAMFAASCRASRKQRELFFREHLPLITKALVDAKQRMFHRDLDSTSFLIYALGTIAAENGSLVPKDEGVDYKSDNNNSAYEDFDVYEPFDPDKDKEWLAGIKTKAEKEHPERHPHRTPKGGNPASGNTKRGDGALYKGRGWAQLTHRESYEDAGRALGLDLLNNPDLAGSANKENAAKILAWQVGTGGHRGDQYTQICAALQIDDARALRKLVNGGAVGLEDFKNAYLMGPQFLQQGYHFRVNRMGL